MPRKEFKLPERDPARDAEMAKRKKDFMSRVFPPKEPGYVNKKVDDGDRYKIDAAIEENRLIKIDSDNKRANSPVELSDVGVAFLNDSIEALAPWAVSETAIAQSKTIDKITGDKVRMAKNLESLLENGDVDKKDIGAVKNEIKKLRKEVSGIIQNNVNNNKLVKIFQKLKVPPKQVGKVITALSKYAGPIGRAFTLFQYGDTVDTIKKYMTGEPRGKD